MTIKEVKPFTMIPVWIAFAVIAVAILGLTWASTRTHESDTIEKMIFNVSIDGTPRTIMFGLRRDGLVTWQEVVADAESARRKVYLTTPKVKGKRTVAVTNRVSP